MNIWFTALVPPRRLQTRFAVDTRLPTRQICYATFPTHFGALMVLLWRFALVFPAAARPHDPREIVRRSIAQDQLDWMRLKDYTWQAHSVQKHFDFRGNV